VKVTVEELLRLLGEKEVTIRLLQQQLATANARLKTTESTEPTDA